MAPPVALTIAGSDPSGGAGVQADLKTFHQHAVYGTAVITLLTVQNTRGVARVEPVDAGLVGAQLDALLEDIPPAAAKTGALGSQAVVEVVAERARRFDFPLVVDPVMISKHGASLLDDGATRALVDGLLPSSTLVTPNIHEASVLAGREVRTLAHVRDAARAIADLGPRGVLVKGGHLAGPPVDVLWWEGALHEVSGERLETRHTHGTGCTYSAAIVAWLARGAAMPDAVARAKRWLTEALRAAPGLGGGIGPVSHFAPVDGAVAEDPAPDDDEGL
ncbi:MAG: bifunctional hydroxymethylpyrimidine kinase/phosphomethylpyrimidine kinase [Myxococcota bacterium]